MKESPQQQAARALVARSIGLQPIRVAKDGKNAIDKAWEKTQHADPDAAAAFFKAHKGNVGVTFPPSIVVIDQDMTGGKDGIAAWRALCARLGMVPPKTLRTLSARGGTHDYFFLPPGVTVKNVKSSLDGVDFKSAGGYVLVEPSTFEGKPYLWDAECGDEIALLPLVLAQEISRLSGATKRASPSKAATGDQPASIIEGQGGNAAFTREIGRLVHAYQGEPREVAEELVVAAALGINRQLCKPPWTDAEAEKKARTHVESWYRRGWSEPRPIKADLPPPPECDIDLLLPPVLALAVKDEADRMGVARDKVAVPIMAALCALLSSKTALRHKVRDKYFTRPGGWMIQVDSSGQNKTGSTRPALQQMHRIAKGEAEMHAARYLDFKREKEAYDFQKKAATKLAEKEFDKLGSGGERMQQMLDLAEPEEPHERRVLVNDVNEEVFGVILSTSPGVLMSVDELARLILTFSRAGRESFRSMLLQCYDAVSSETVERMTRKVHIPLLCASIFGNMQPDLFERLFNNPDSALAMDGFLQRFQWSVFCEPRGAIRFIDAEPDEAATAYLSDVFDRCHTFEPDRYGAVSPTSKVPIPHFVLGVEAQELFVEWWTELVNERAAKDPDPLLQQHLNKYDKLFCSAAVVIHVAQDCRGPIDKTTALRAAAWCQLLEGHARRIYALSGTAKVRTAQLLGGKLAAGKLEDGFTANDVARKDWTGLKSSRDAEVALAVLEEHGWVQSELSQNPNGGPQTRRYDVSPHVRKEKP